MTKALGRWFQVYENEITIFLWTTLLRVLVRGSGILLNNYAETAFLKRYGVEFMPIVNMVNAVATFVIMGVMTGFITRYPGARLLGILFVFCGSTIALIWFLIPLNIDLIYPLLFMLKSQYEVLLALLFWNLANDLFNTRQSKRLFPLITAGGVLGQIIGSFATPWMAKAFTLDNLLLAYLGTTLTGSVVVWAMSRKFPTLLFTDTKSGTAKKRKNLIAEVKNVFPLMKESLMIKLLILLTFVPNVIIPIMNYQFNYAINDQFATEAGMIQFFGYFRGILNIISLIILLFVGRIYGRWGLPVALMFHPINYLIVFISFLLRFDTFTAMYARLSSNVIRTTINIPAMAIVTGLFPEAYRNMVRPFLRGTVVRIGLFLGSSLILISEPLFHPRYLSAVALPFVLVWIVVPFVLKRNYVKILLDLISRDMLDFKRMQSQDLSQLFQDKKIQAHMIQQFASARGKDCLWHARLLDSVGVGELDAHILRHLQKPHDDETKIGLLEMLTPGCSQEALPVFQRLVDHDRPLLTASLVRTANRLSPQVFSSFTRSVFEASTSAHVRAHAVTGLYSQAPEQYRPVIDTWLGSSDAGERRAGVIAAARTADQTYLEPLIAMTTSETDTQILPVVVEGLQRLGDDKLNQRVRPFLSHSEAEVRAAALAGYTIDDDRSLQDVILMLGDGSDEIQTQARAKIETAGYSNAAVLVAALSLPMRQVRDGIFAVLESMQIKDIDTIRFAEAEIEKSYQYLADSENTSVIVEGPQRDLLKQHLYEQHRLKLENVLRVLAAQDRSGQMKVITRGIFSLDQRRKGNSVEALDDLLDKSLTKIILPLLGDDALDQRLAAGRKYFSLSEFPGDTPGFYGHLLTGEDWVTLTLVLELLGAEKTVPLDRNVLEMSLKNAYGSVRQAARRLLEESAQGKGAKETEMESDLSVPDKILYLKGIDIFEGLTIGELAAVASITDEETHDEQENVITEGDLGETLYLIIDGEVAVIKGWATEQPVELDHIATGNYFGEMALFEDQRRSATVRTVVPSGFLIIHKQELKEIVREYPQIALHACKVLSGRLRKLHSKVTDCVV